MRHPTEGVLRRLLDEPAGVADTDRQHVATCPDCLARLAAAREDAALVGAALSAHGAADVDVAAAWQRMAAGMSTGVTPEQPSNTSVAGPGREARPAKAGRSRAFLRRPVVAALTVALVVAGAGTAAANDWL